MGPIRQVVSLSQASRIRSYAALVVWSMREAKQLGHAVDERFLSELRSR